MVNICHSCDRPYEVWEATVEHPYQYTESGLPNIRLAGVKVYSCPNCQLESAEIPNLDGLHDLIARHIVLTPQPMTGTELRFLRKETRLKPKEFAERLGVDPKTTTNWEVSGKLNRQTDITVRMLVAPALWQGKALTDVLTPLAEIAKYSWEEDPDELNQEIAQLAEQNTVLGMDDQHQWGTRG